MYLANLHMKMWKLSILIYILQLFYFIISFFKKEICVKWCYFYFYVYSFLLILKLFLFLFNFITLFFKKSYVLNNIFNCSVGLIGVLLIISEYRCPIEEKKRENNIFKCHSKALEAVEWLAKQLALK